MSPYGVPAPGSPHILASDARPSNDSSLPHLSEPGPGIAGHRFPAWLLSILVVAALLRFAGLGRESIWLDEATSLIIARMNISSVVAWAAADVHPPLYYLTLHLWLRLGESEFAIRSLSAALGVVTIAVVYVMGRELFNTRTGLLSAVLLAAAPLHVWYSQEARMYAMVTMLSLLASYLMLVYLRQAAGRGRDPSVESRSSWVAYVIVAALSLYTHYFALVALVFLNLFALYLLWRHGSSAWRGWLGAQLAVVSLFLPWAPTLYRQVTTGGGGWVERAVGSPGLDALMDTWLYFSVGLDSQLYPVWLRRAAYLLFVVCILTAIRRLLHSSKLGSRSERAREGILFCLMCGAAPVLSVWLLSQAKPMYSIRFLLPFLPSYCTLVAAGIDRLPWKWMRLAVVVLLVLTLVVGNWNVWRVEQNPDWRGVASYVWERAQASDVVLFSPRWNVKPFEYYNRGRVDINMDLPIPVTELSVQKVVADISLRYRRVWLVWQRGHYSDPTGLAKQVLDSEYESVIERGFRGVDRLILYDLTGQSGS